MPWFTDGQVYPPLGTAAALAATGSDPEAPGYSEVSKDITLELPEDWASVTYGTLSEDEDSLASLIVGATIEEGDQHYYPSAQITIYDDSTFADAPAGSLVTWLRKESSGEMVRVTIINGYIDSGAGTSVTAETLSGSVLQGQSLQGLTL
jgi:hypothetical protein